VLEFVELKQEFPEDFQFDNSSLDYTPPNYLTLLFTDLGVLTPSAVSDELIKLYS
jgi:translation initiation factor eIF-2B subunit alpha